MPLDTDDEDQLLLSRDVEVASLLGDAVEADLLALGIAVLLDVLLSTLEDDLALVLVGLLHRGGLASFQIRNRTPPVVTTKDMVLCQGSDPKDGNFATASTESSRKGYVVHHFLDTTTPHKGRQRWRLTFLVFSCSASLSARAFS